jgi:hypothetical protein
LPTAFAAINLAAIRGPNDWPLVIVLHHDA